MMTIRRTKTRKPRQPKWLKSLDEWIQDQCLGYLNEQPALPLNHRWVKALSGMTPNQLLKIEAELEKAGEHEDITQAWVIGAIAALVAGDYCCPLIYRYINARALSAALKV